mmetsp:Transcript_3593/g.11308  ORF Transcript_3593/g.11308 Transcript_3593/m.11308 type:complete len:250 (-) Transcript_3593:2907-3656(-)
MDRTADGFFHLGDLTIRGSYANGPQVDCASVGSGAVAQSKALADVAPETGASLLAGGTLRRPAKVGVWLWRHMRRVPLVSGRGRTGTGACPLAAAHAGGASATVSDGPLRVRRELVAEAPSAGGALIMRLRLQNAGEAPLKIASLGLAMPFDQDFVGRTLPQVCPRASPVRPLPPAPRGPPHELVACTHLTNRAGRHDLLLRGAVSGHGCGVRAGDARHRQRPRPPPRARGGHLYRGVARLWRRRRNAA